MRTPTQPRPPKPKKCGLTSRSNKQLTTQRRRVLSKHYAAKYRSR